MLGRRTMQLSDRFELGRPLGHGAFGTTYLGRERASGRAVAIKRLRLQGLPEWRPFERFEREARVLRSLDHPGLPAFIDAFEADDPDGGLAFYIVSEFVEGSTLQAQIADGRRWSAAAARALLRSLLETLDYLHSLSPRVIHRDIKPGNVIIRPDERPILVDFGSVRDVAARVDDGDVTIAGTAGYMAPEQAYGVADVRSDLHGLGATLAHALTHVHPSDLPRTGLRPHLRDLAGIDEQLGRILERLLEPEPERRYESAAAVLRELDQRPAVPASAALVHADPSSQLAPTHSIGSAELARLTEAPRAIDSRLGKLLDTRDASLPQPVALALFVMFAGIFAALGVGLFLGRALAVVTLLMGFAGFFAVLNRQRGTARRLFAGGCMARAEIRRASPAEAGLQVHYGFRHDGREFTGMLCIDDAFVARSVEPDTLVLVFFDPATPERNVGLVVHELAPEGRT